VTLPISEHFLSIQGEGPRAGRLCYFIRTGGCNLSCSWCVDPETPVLMADWSERPIREVREGDLVMSYRDRRYESARVEKTMSRYVDERVTVVTDEGEIVCTPDHIFANPHHIDGRRRSRADELVGRHVVRSKGWAPDEEVRTYGWWTGWAQGLILGDGHVGTGRFPQVWLRVCDKELADAYCRVARSHGAGCTVKEVTRRTTTGNVVYSVTHHVSKFPGVVGLPEHPDEIAGFLAGFFDAEGYVGKNQVELSQKDDKTLDRVYGMLQSLCIAATLKHTAGRKVGTITINGAANVDAFMRLTRPLDRKCRKRQNITSRQLAAVPVLAVKEAEPGDVHNITTSTGYFFAGGILVENCDTPYSWDASRYDLRKEFTPMTAKQIIDCVPRDIGEVVITGGEPLMHQRNPQWDELLERLYRRSIFTAVETNGTILPGGGSKMFIQHYSISPKLPNAGEHKKGQDPALREWPVGVGVGKRAILKFVVEDATDVKLAVEMADAHGWHRDQVWVMPEGTDAQTLMRRWPEIVTEAIAQRVHATQRLHVLAFGDQRGT
jgi:7-carboxy-7-deazaguanine synthase